MSTSMVSQLILKDWFFQKKLIMTCIALGLVCIYFIQAGSGLAFYMGSTLLITLVVGFGVYLIVEMVIYERKNQTLPFIMSLPVSYKEYTAAKILASLWTFLVPWATLVGTTVVVIATRDTIPNGLIPFALLLLLELLACHCLILAVAIVTESLGWTITTMIFCNLFLQFFMYSVSNIAEIKASMEGPAAVWTSSFFSIMAAEIAVMVLSIGITFALQARKKSFI